MGEVQQAIEEHVKTHHLGMSKEDISKAFREHYSLIENGRKLDMLVDDYFGEPVVDIDGEIVRTGATKAKNDLTWEVATDRLKNVEATTSVLKQKLENGGVPVKLSKAQWIALVAALAPVVAASLTVLFG